MDNRNIEVFSAILNCVLLTGNIYWQNRFKSTQANSQLIDMLTKESSAKDEIIKNLTRQVKMYQNQLHHVSVENHKLKR